MTCPRCQGRLYEDSDQHGRFLSCINCGYLEPIDSYDPNGTREPAHTGHKARRAIHSRRKVP